VWRAPFFAICPSGPYSFPAPPLSGTLGPFRLRPPPAPADQASAALRIAKSNVTAAWLGLFLGPVGLWYKGEVGRGVHLARGNDSLRRRVGRTRVTLLRDRHGDSRCLCRREVRRLVGAPKGQGAGTSGESMRTGPVTRCHHARAVSIRGRSESARVAIKWKKGVPRARFGGIGSPLAARRGKGSPVDGKPDFPLSLAAVEEAATVDHFRFSPRLSRVLQPPGYVRHARPGH
jgi:hypothetical protein